MVRENLVRNCLFGDFKVEDRKGFSSYFALLLSKTKKRKKNTMQANKKLSNVQGDVRVRLLNFIDNRKMTVE